VRQNAERQRDALRRSILHQRELAIRGDESDGAVSLEARQAHALVEREVVQIDAGPSEAKSEFTRKKKKKKEGRKNRELLLLLRCTIMK
jgi:hypothetical protein